MTTPGTENVEKKPFSRSGEFLRFQDAYSRFVLGVGPALLAAGVPFVLYLATASSAGHWFDSGTFVAQATDLGIAHPPGHPLAGIVNSLAMCLPFGTIAFRVALVAALCVSAALAFVFRASVTTFRSVGLTLELASPIALFATWWLGASYGVWMQAVRPEVYGLQFLLMSFIVERVVHFEWCTPRVDSGALITAAFAFGLALANHHFLAFLLLPAIAATLGRWVRAAGPRPLGWASLAGLGGFLTYVYLPLRASSDAALRLGTPNTPANFYWTVSAQAFQGNQGDGVPQPLGERMADTVVAVAESLHLGVLFAALAGAYILVRLSRSRSIGVFWSLLLVVFLAARGWLGFVRNNPDALGYLLIAMTALVITACALFAVIIRFAYDASEKLRTPVLLLTVCLPLVAFTQLDRSKSLERVTGLQVASRLDSTLRRDLPADAILIAHSPQTIFRYFGGEATEALRPDVTLVPMPLLPYPGMVDALAEEAPELRSLLRGVLESGRLRSRDLQNLDTRRPVLVELDPRVTPDIWPSLVPRGAYYEVLRGDANVSDRREGAAAQTALYEELLARLGALNALDEETRAQLFWRRYQDALFFGAQGDRDFARNAIDTALDINDADEQVRALAAAIQTPNENGELNGPINLELLPAL